MANSRQGLTLGEGFYWMAEKLAWGDEGIERNLVEAFKLFQQAADLGFSDALIRVGEFQEYGKGTDRNPNAAVISYNKAVSAGNYYGLALLGKLLSQSLHLEKADEVWNCFFSALKVNPDPGFVAAGRGELFHDYIATQLRLGFDPQNKDILLTYRQEIVGHHLRLLEYGRAGRSTGLEGISKWIELNWGLGQLRCE